MAVVDSLEIDIQSKSESVKKSLDDLVERLGLVAEGIDAIGKNSGLADFAKKAKETVQGLSGISSAAKNFSAGIEPQIQKVSKSISDVAKEFQEKFKNIPVKIDFSKSESELAKFQKQAQTAENALSRIMASSTADKQIKGIEKWSISLAQANNAIRQIQSKLEEETKLNINVDTKALESTEDLIERMKTHIQQMLAGEVIDNPINIPDLSDEQFEIFKELEAQAISASRNVEENLEQVSQTVRETTESASKPIKIRTEGTEEVQQNISNLSSQLQNMGDLMKRAFTLSAIRDIDNWYQLAEGVKNYFKNAQLAAGVKIYTDDYKNVLSDVERTESALEKLQQKQRDMEASRTDTESKEWQKVASEIATAERQLRAYVDEKQEMEVRGTDVEFTGGLANQSVLKNMGIVAGEAMSSLRQRLSEIPSAVSQAIGNIPVIGRVAKEAAFLGQSAFNGFKFALSRIPKVASAAASAISKVASMVAKLVSGVKDAISKLSKMAKSFLGLKSASKGMNTSLGGGFKMFLRYGLGVRSTYALINKLRNAFKEGSKNLTQYSDEYNRSISSMTSALFSLKNASSVAFEPLVNLVEPYITAFIHMLVDAANAVGRFFSALTGKSIADQAKKVYGSYADSVSKAGSAAKKAGKDVQQGIRSFDELKVINTNKDNEGNGGSGILDDLLATDMFETVQIEDNISNLAQKVKDAWSNVDFTEIGQILGIKLKSALESIPWDPIQEIAAKIGKSLGTLINGFVEADGLADSIGRTVGETINIQITGINNFLDGTHWDSVGIFIGEGLNRIVNTVDWEGLGHLFAAKINAIFETISIFSTTFNWSEFGTSLSNGLVTFISDLDTSFIGLSIGESVKGLLDTFIAFVENTDWKELGNTVAQKISDFFASIDWSGISDRLFEGLGEALAGIGLFIWGLIEEAWNSVIEWWQETAFEDGQFTITGLLNGIWEGIKNIGTWIYEHIFKPFIGGFKKAFGIASPSKVMKEQGGYIVSGFLNGLKENIRSVWDWVSEIPGKMLDFFKDLPSNFLEIGKNIISGLWEGIKNAWEGVSTGIKEIGSGIIDTFKNILDIHSPSRVMFQLGDYTMQGFQNGLENLQQPILRSMKDFSYEIAVAPATSISDIYGNYDYEISDMISQSNVSDYRKDNAETNRLLREQNSLLKAILAKPSMGIGELGAELAKESWIRGGNTGTSGIRLAVAEELYG